MLLLLLLLLTFVIFILRTYCFCVYIDFLKFVVVYKDFKLSKYFVTASLKTAFDTQVLGIFLMYLYNKLLFLDVINIKCYD